MTAPASSTFLDQIRAIAAATPDHRQRLAEMVGAMTRLLAELGYGAAVEEIERLTRWRREFDVA